MRDSVGPPVFIHKLSRLIHALFAMARPLQVAAVLLVFTLGAVTAWASGYPIQSQQVVRGVVALLFVTLSIHYANEYADAGTDALTKRTPYSGGSGILPRGLVSRQVAHVAAWTTLITSIVFQVSYGARVKDSWTASVILLVGAFGGWMYSLPPLRLAWRGWGELTNALLGGALLPLYGYVVVSRQFDWRVLLIWAPFSLLVFTNLLAVTWPDRQADEMVGKYTLATRWSVVRLRRIYFLATVMSFGVLVAISDGVLPRLVASWSFVALPLAVWGTASYTRRETPAPSVWAMVAMLLAQTVGWYVVGIRL